MSKSGSGLKRTHARLGLPPSIVKKFSPDPDGPMDRVHLVSLPRNTATGSASRMVLPKDQWCYLPNESGDYAEGMTIPADVLERTGYRLAHRGGMGIRLPLGHRHQLLLRPVQRASGQVCLVSGQQQGTRLAMRELAAERPGTV